MHLESDQIYVPVKAMSKFKPVSEKRSTLLSNDRTLHCTEVRFASFLSGGFIAAIVVNPPERKLAKRTSVQWFADLALGHFKLLLKSSILIFLSCKK